MGKSKRSSLINGGVDAVKSSKHSETNGAIQLQNGFLAVPLSIPHHEAVHWLYVRQHTSSSSTTGSTSKVVAVEAGGGLPIDRTMFVANLPIDASEEWIRAVFGKVGGVSGVKFRKGILVEEEDEREVLGEGEGSDDEEEEGEEEHHLASASTSTPGKGRRGRKKGQQQERKNRVPKVIPLPAMDPRQAVGGESLLTTASSAHVVFMDGTSFGRAMDLLRSGLKWPSPKTSTPPPTGLEYLLGQHTLCRPPLPAVQTWANSVISLYTHRLAHPAPRRIGVRGVTLGPSGELLDSDGFIIVQRSGKYGRAGASAEGGGSVGIARGGYVAGKNGKRKSEGLEDFYRFQVRERKREELKELRVRFEKDKEKVERLKAGRRFKPY